MGFLAIHERFGLCGLVLGVLTCLRGVLARLLGVARWLLSGLRLVLVGFGRRFGLGGLFFGNESTEVFQAVSFLPFGGVGGEF